MARDNTQRLQILHHADLSDVLVAIMRVHANDLIFLNSIQTSFLGLQQICKEG